MQFRDLKKQYEVLKSRIDSAVTQVMADSNFISGKQVTELEQALAEYVGVKHCITCANGTDALSLALEAWNIGPGDAVFVPDFTFFASGETVAFEGATPVFVDILEDTFNMNPESLKKAVEVVKAEGKLTPKAVVTVDLFGQPADYDKILPIVRENNMLLLEDGAQGFGGDIRGKKACSFGDIATTSFFPAKPLGCYGDGGAIFTDNDEWAALIKSLRIHGKGEDKYDNVRIGMNSRLDTIQAAILQVKFDAFKDYELADVNKVAECYTGKLKGIVKTPTVLNGFLSSWAQYSILLKDASERDGLQAFLKERGIPSMIYYPKGMHRQKAFEGSDCVKTDLSVTDSVCNRVLALPLHPYLDEATQDSVAEAIKEFFAAR
ncbi:MAG: DegT/DnrJ/EryC1/StrS family aminotransferase [Lachnospiraceae bacterium]|nr:DegT/DnrJ/EryC1/StrS family aminotransferase [Lachnospiraceae bacterium]